MPSETAPLLPIHQQREEILDAIARHRVVVLEGPTGCGKTTQLPRILLQSPIFESVLGGGRIGVTQPRRIAAVSVAWRIAAELGCKLGDEVGYAIRFDDCTSKRTRIKIMTDGILLQESRLEPLFDPYALVVIDEAHERTLNIDLCLGLLLQALERRRDLRVVISSATLRPELFQRFFAPVVGQVPRISIAARVHPVNVVYRPPQATDPDTLALAVADEISRIHRGPEPGHVLAFLSGEGMIKSTLELLERRKLKGLVPLPLYGQLTREEQERVFDEVDGRKAILATNIAETSITIPNVQFVVDTGIAKVPRFDGRSGITALREEPICLASLAQRAGRAGRTGPGTAIRLFDERSLQRRADFGDEEILRLELSEVVLRLIDLGVQEPESFPFPTPPPSKAIRRALWVLRQLGAIVTSGKHSEGNGKDAAESWVLTEIGKKMVPFPLSPALARMVVEAATSSPEVLDEVLVVAASLGVRPPYLSPAGEEAAARRVHVELGHKLGDAATAVQLFRRWEKAGDRAQFCRAHYLDPNTLAFIANARAQLADIAKQLGFVVQGGGPLELLNAALAVAFPNHFLLRRANAYETRSGERVAIHPSSSLFGAKHRFLVASELVQSRRVFAHNVAIVRPEWIARANPELAREWQIETRSEPRSPIAASAEAGVVRIGSVELRTVVKPGRVMVAVPRELVDELRRQPAGAVPAFARSFEAHVRDGRYRWLDEMPLGLLVGLLPIVPLATRDILAEDFLPQGALFDAERNLHAIERYLPLLLEPCFPVRSRQPGWLKIVHNGGEGFWFEATSDFVDAVECSVDGLEALYEGYADDDPERTKLTAQIDDLRAKLKRIETLRRELSAS